MTPPVWDVDFTRRLGSGVHGFQLDVAFASPSRRLVLFGPSGAGKSQTLRTLAGLARPQHGHVRLLDDTLADTARGIDVPARDRRLGFVFQDYALFPHLTVAQNLAFGVHPGVVNPRRAARHPEVLRWLAAFGLAPLADRLPEQLSGGQRQRAALARALVPAPRALLLDEPFAALDAPLRDRLRTELRALLASVDLPLVLITHDPADAEQLGGDVLHILDGRLRA